MAFSKSKQGTRPIATLERIDKLLHKLRSPNSNIRYRAALSLGRIRAAGEAAVPRLMELLKDTKVEVRHSATSALCAMVHHVPAAVPALIEALKDENSGICFQAAHALGNTAIGTEWEVRNVGATAVTEAIALWTSAQRNLDAIDSEAMRYHPSFEKAKTDIQHLVDTLQAAQAGNLAPGYSP